MRAGLSIVCATLVVFAVGCETLDEAARIGAEIALAEGVISTNEAEAITRSAVAVGRALASVTPRQEYYIGRSVGASVLGRYRPSHNRAVNDYLNELGQTLATCSDRPETYGGYHFLALDTDEVNAFAAPGGLIFVSRGMLGLCRREADVAAVLAHEIGHVQAKHGLRAITQNRWVSAALVTGLELAKADNPDKDELTQAFGGVVEGVADVLLVKGYGRKLEREADRIAVAILKRVGYDPGALADVLTHLERSTKPGGRGFGRTHPAPATRRRLVQNAVGTGSARPAPAARAARFAKFARSI